MKDSEMVFTVIVLAGAYYWFVVRGKNGYLQGRLSTGRSGTVAGGASKMPTRFQNSNARTNAHQGSGYRAAPIAYSGYTPGPYASNVGGSRYGGLYSSQTGGPAGSFVSNAWPMTRVTSMGSVPIDSGMAQIPSYTAVPLTIQGPGGGGTLVQ